MNGNAGCLTISGALSRPSFQPSPVSRRGRVAWRAFLAVIGLSVVAAAGAVAAPSSRVLTVCPECKLALPSAAADVARDGDTVEIQAGDYRGDVAVWRQNGITIRGVGGRPRLFADGRAAEGKAIWVMKGADVVVENLEFVGARVPDRNGAGIRAEGRGLTVRDSAFFDNEMGLLTGNDPQAWLVVERSEFGRNGVRDGSHHHGLYAGRIGSLTVRHSYFQHALDGHLLKSRARVNDIRCNRLEDGEGGQASYELEFPEGGDAVVVGNVIEQSATSPNSTMLSYAAEAKGVAAFNVFAGAPAAVVSGPMEITANATVPLTVVHGEDFCVADLPAFLADEVDQARALLGGVSAEMEPPGILSGRPRAAGNLAVPGAVTECESRAR